MKNQLRAFWSSDTSLTILLWTLGITIFFVIPVLVLLGAPEWERAVAALFFTVLVASGAYSVWSRAEVRRLVVVLAGAPLVMLWIEIAYHPPLLSLVSGALRLLLVGLFSAVLIARVLAPGPVTRARIKGALAVYLLIGVLFEEGYRALSIAYPGAITVHASNSLSIKFTAELLYFSFSTMTTAGYGDIIPLHPLARSLANLEAITGQLYIVLLIGRLLTLHMAQDEPTEGGLEVDRTTSPRRPYREG